MVEQDGDQRNRRFHQGGIPPVDGSAAVRIDAHLSAPSLADELEQFDLFHHMPPERRGQLLQAAERITFEKHREVITPSDRVFIILSGAADCFLRDAADGEFRLGILGAGAPVGELSHLLPPNEASNDGKVRIVARGALSVVSLPAAAFLHAVLKTPESAHALLSIFGARISEMNRFANQAVDVNLNPDKVRPTTQHERLADWITSRVGTFRFLGGLAVASGVWMLVNVGMVMWDPYPYVFLNLIFSVMSATTTSVLLISQNRGSQLDRVKARAGQRVLMRISRQVDALMALTQGAKKDE